MGGALYLGLKHGVGTLPWAQTWGWADIRDINIVYYEILTTSLVAPLDRVYIMVQGHHVCK